MSKASFEYLSSVRDAKARKLIIHKLPIPDIPVCITKEELEGYEFEEGEDVREVGERLAASYVNFYFSNNAVVMPCLLYTSCDRGTFDRQTGDIRSGGIL